MARIRLAVVDTNSDVTGFWRRMGFTPTGEVIDYVAGAIESKVRILVKDL